MSKILLVGPSKKIKYRSKTFYQKYQNEGHKIVSYTGSITYLNRIQIIPDYFVFFDPSTLYDNEDFIKTNLEYFQKIELFGYNIYQNNLENFKCYGYSTSFYKNDKILDKTQYLENLFLYFKETKLKNFDEIINLLELQDYYSFDKKLMLFSAYGKMQVDKFFGMLLPLIFNQYKHIRSIHCVGFGDFTVRRCGGSSKGYTGYINCAKLLSPIIKKYLIENQIEISFEDTRLNTFHRLLKK
jgi:hypothetical protein